MKQHKGRKKTNIFLFGSSIWLQVIRTTMLQLHFLESVNPKIFKSNADYDKNKQMQKRVQEVKTLP